MRSRLSDLGPIAIRRWMWLVFMISFASTIGCEPPRQASFAQVEVAPGVEGRLRWMDALRLHDEQRQAMTESQEHVVALCDNHQIFDDTDEGDFTVADGDNGRQPQTNAQPMTTETVIHVPQPCPRVVH